MDPYLEHPELWPGFHTALIAELSRMMNRRVTPRYVVAVEQRTYMLEPEEIVLIGRPDVALLETQAAERLRRSPPEDPAAAAAATATVSAPRAVTLSIPEEVRERYLEVRDVTSGEAVTVIELLSPTNKLSGTGRQRYEEKRRAAPGSLTSLVEVDLLRAGRRLPMRPADMRAPYSILVARGYRHGKADLYEFGVRDPIPAFPVPLRQGDAEPTIELRPLLDAVYDDGRYDLRLDYARPAVPPLDAGEATWGQSLTTRTGADGRGGPGNRGR